MKYEWELQNGICKLNAAYKKCNNSPKHATNLEISFDENDYSRNIFRFYDFLFR